jgi:hypothetical protein
MLSCIDRLRLQADAIDDAGRLLLADCARALRQQGPRGKSWDDACMDLSMAREALETCGWWLRRCAEDMEKLERAKEVQDEPAGNRV